MKLGSTDISKIYLGGTEVTKAYLGSTLVHGGTTPVLPYDAQVEYLKNTSNAVGAMYFVTDYKPNTKTRVVLTANVTTNTKQGRWMYSAKNPLRLDVYENGSTRYAYTFNISDDNKSTGVAPSTGTAVIDIDGVAKTLKITVNGTLKVNLSNITMPSSYTENDSYLQIFGRDVSENHKMEAVSCEIYDDGVKVREYISVRKNGVGALYESFTDSLIYNSGNATLTIGPDV